MSKGIFIIGTGTDVGKTYISGLILKALHSHGLKAAYFKAAMSGNIRNTEGNLIPGDATFVKKLSGITEPLEEMCPYIYERPLSPHLAAKIEGNPPQLNTIKKAYQKLQAKYDYITMEGSGGIICPLAQKADKFLWLEDIIKELSLGCLLVADAGLGTINQTALTAFYLKEKNIPLKGLIFNNFEPDNPMHEDNIKICQQLTNAPVLACIEKGQTILQVDITKLINLYE